MKIRKSEIARNHIEAAIDLYRSGGDRACIVTLAGAAEEVLGKLVSRQGKKNVIAGLAEAATRDGSSLTPVQLSRLINRTRNALKHANDIDEDEIEIHPDEATAMLTRGMINYMQLTGAFSPKMHEFYEWLRQNWLSRHHQPGR